jgi:hypothetical protein
MFDARDANKENSNLHHMAEMVALLGPPPRKMLQRSEYASEFFDKQGMPRSMFLSILITTFPIRDKSTGHE